MKLKGVSDLSLVERDRALRRKRDDDGKNVRGMEDGKREGKNRVRKGIDLMKNALKLESERREGENDDSGKESL